MLTLLLQEKKSGNSEGLVCDIDTQSVIPPGKQPYNFDKVFHPKVHQEFVFDHTARPLLPDIFNGYNATIFAYGQTGSGKTFTMMGDPKRQEMRGVIPRLVEVMFERIETCEDETEFMLSVSYVEIYMELIQDLFNPAKSNLKVRQTEDGNVFIEDVTEVYVGSYEEVMMLMEQGGINRSIAATEMNNESSRSHSVFSLTMVQKEPKTGSTKTSKLHLVDLAGSERQKKTHSVGQTLEEAKHINKSLSALGGVINALTEGQQHVPYRDSKLTRLLTDALGGNSRTVLIVTCSPAESEYEDTINALRFGVRAKKIKNKAKANTEFSVLEYKRIIEDLKAKIATMDKVIKYIQKENEMLKGRNPDLAKLLPRLSPCGTPTNQDKERLTALQAQLKGLREEQADWETERQALNSRLEQMGEEKQRWGEERKRMESELAEVRKGEEEKQHALGTELELLKEKHSRLQLEKEQLQTRNLALVEDKTRLSQRLSQAIQYKALQQELNQQISVLKEAGRSLQLDLKQKDQQRRQLLRDKKNLEQELKVAHQQIEENAAAVVQSMAAASLAPNIMAAASLAHNSMAAASLAHNSMAAASLAHNSMAAASLAPNSMAAASLVHNSMAAASLAHNSMAAAGLVHNSIAAASLAHNSMAAASLAPNVPEETEKRLETLEKEKKAMEKEKKDWLYEKQKWYELKSEWDRHRQELAEQAGGLEREKDRLEQKLTAYRLVEQRERELGQELEQLKEKQTLLQQENQQLQHRNQQLVEEKENAAHEKRQELSDLQHAHRILTSQSQQQQAQLNELQTLKTQLEKDLQEARSETAELKAQLARATQDVSAKATPDLSARLEDATQDLSAKATPEDRIGEEGIQHRGQTDLDGADDVDSSPRQRSSTLGEDSTPLQPSSFDDSSRLDRDLTPLGRSESGSSLTFQRLTIAANNNTEPSIAPRSSPTSSKSGLESLAEMLLRSDDERRQINEQLKTSRLQVDELREERDELRLQVLKQNLQLDSVQPQLSELGELRKQVLLLQEQLGEAKHQVHTLQQEQLIFEKERALHEQQLANEVAKAKIERRTLDMQVQALRMSWSSMQMQQHTQERRKQSLPLPPNSPEHKWSYGLLSGASSPSPSRKEQHNIAPRTISHSNSFSSNSMEEEVVRVGSPVKPVAFAKSKDKPNSMSSPFSAADKEKASQGDSQADKTHAPDNQDKEKVEDGGDGQLDVHSNRPVSKRLSLFRFGWSQKGRVADGSVTTSTSLPASPTPPTISLPSSPTPPTSLAASRATAFVQKEPAKALTEKSGQRGSNKNAAVAEATVHGEQGKQDKTLQDAVKQASSSPDSTPKQSPKPSPQLIVSPPPLRSPSKTTTPTKTDTAHIDDSMSSAARERQESLAASDFMTNETTQRKQEELGKMSSGELQQYVHKLQERLLSDETSLKLEKELVAEERHRVELLKQSLATANAKSEAQRQKIASLEQELDKYHVWWNMTFGDKSKAKNRFVLAQGSKSSTPSSSSTTASPTFIVPPEHKADGELSLSIPSLLLEGASASWSLKTPNGTAVSSSKIIRPLVPRVFSLEREGSSEKAHRTASVDVTQLPTIDLDSENHIQVPQSVYSINVNPVHHDTHHNGVQGLPRFSTE
eukprot:g40283.t1